MSDKRPFTTINPKKVKSDYPKTYSSIVDWLKKSATEGNLITEQMVEAFIYGNPRFLYDYFDDVDIVCSLDIPEKIECWIPVIKMPGVHLGYGQYLSHTRKEAEEALFEEAFKIQEDKLCQKP